MRSGQICRDNFLPNAPTVAETDESTKGICSFEMIKRMGRFIARKRAIFLEISRGISRTFTTLSLKFLRVALARQLRFFKKLIYFASMNTYGLRDHKLSLLCSVNHVQNTDKN